MNNRCEDCGAKLVETTISVPCSDAYCEGGDWYGKSYNEPNPSTCPTCNGTGTESKIITNCPKCDNDYTEVHI
jgi:hypothetical protein